ncbi:MAG: SLC13 family permease [Akkermansia sp.]|nr:SLC13 family permease [Akkermansia sp.]
MTKETKSILIKVLITLAISAGVFLVPFEALGVPVNSVQISVIALFVFAALMWILEPIPIWATSVMVIAICLLALSNKAFNFLRPVSSYDKDAVCAIIEEVVGTDGAAAQASVKDPQKDGSIKWISPLKKIEKDVNERLTKKGKFNEEEFYTSMNYVMLNTANKAEAAAAKALAEGAADSPAHDAATDAMNADTPAALAKNIGYQQQLAIDLKDASKKLVDKDLQKRIKTLATHSVNVMNSKNTMATFADPIIILFLGGFFLAAAATKYGLDQNLARVLVRPFGTNPKMVMLGLMAVTALFSMFMSNTATAAMMIAILTPVLKLIPGSDKGRIAIALCIPLGANIGGMGTPIGTPPNAVAIKTLQSLDLSVSFGKWMAIGIPYVILLLFFAWLVLMWMFPFKIKELKLDIGGVFRKDFHALVVYATFIVTIFLWVTADIKIPGVFEGWGVDSNTIAIIPIAVFAVTGVITAKDLKLLEWDVLWLVAGGFALGVALEETQLAKDLINAIPFASWSFFALMVGACFISMFAATFMSNSATAALLMPILGTVAGGMMHAGSMSAPDAAGLMVAVAFSTSLAFALPISTPPNAIAYATGVVPQSAMAKSGVVLCLIGFALAIVMSYMLINFGFFS